MFVYRLKNELREERSWLCIWAVYLVLQVWSVWYWWTGELIGTSEFRQIVTDLIPLVGICIVLRTCFAVFKRDILKDPQAFWATRPVRALPMFGAKFTYLQLVISLPLAVMVLVVGCVLGNVGVAFWNAVEIFLWSLFVTGIFGFSMMAARNSNMIFTVVGLFFAGVIGAIVFFESDLAEVLTPYRVDDSEGVQNAFLMLVVLAVVVALGIFWLARDKHRRFRWWVAPLAGVGVVTLCSFVKLPVVVGGHETIEMSDVTAGSGKVLEMRYARSVVYDGVPGYEFQYWVNLAPSLPKEGTYLVVGGDVWFESDESRVLEFGAQSAGMHFHRDDGETFFHSQLQLRIMKERDYSTNSSSSSSGMNGDELTTFQEMAKKLVRVRGYVDVRIDGYEEVHRGELDEGFVYEREGLVIEYDAQGRIRPGTKRGGTLVWKHYGLGLLTTPPLAFGELMKLRAENGDVVLSGENSGLSRGSCFLGSWSEKEESFLSLENGRGWTMLKHQERVGDFANWREGARLVAEARVRSRVVRVPVDVEVLIPDPAKVLELLE